MRSFEEKVEYLKKNLAELKEDIVILNQNIAEMEYIIDSCKSEDDLKKHYDFDLEHGLKHIELF